MIIKVKTYLEDHADVSSVDTDYFVIVYHLHHVTPTNVGVVSFPHLSSRLV